MTKKILKNKNSKIIRNVVITLSLIIISIKIVFVSGCDQKFISETLSAKNDEILIGIVKTSTFSNFFVEGVNLAIEEINGKGGILGKKVRTILYDDMNDPDKAESIAESLISYKNLIAVVGHYDSNVAIPASIIYEKAGVLYISYGAEDPALTRYKGSFTFRNIPTYIDFGTEMAKLCQGKAKKMMIFYERDTALKILADIFKEHVSQLGIEIVATRSYFNWESDFKNLISSIKQEYEFDGVFIAGTIPSAAELIKQLREMGINVPILGGDGLDSSDLWVIAGKASENIVVPTVFNSTYPDKIVREFVGRFETKYSIVPDTWAAQGYDAISVIAHTIEKCKSINPIEIANELRFIDKWKGVTGSYAFNTQGDITGKKIFFKVMRNGGFVFLKKDQIFESDLFNYIEEYTLRLPMQGSVYTLDPGMTTDVNSIELVEQLFLGLTDLNPETYEPEPELATSWEIKENSTEYTFFLRKNAKWTDGKPVTANDIVWAIKRNIDPALNSPSAHMLYILKNAKAINAGQIKDLNLIGVEAIDDWTIKFFLEYPAIYFPTLAGLWIYRPLPKETIEKYKDKWTEPENIQVNGYYKPVIWEKEKGIFLRKNPTFFDHKKVTIPEVRYFFISQGSMGFAMYDNNELDIMGSTYLRLPTWAFSQIRQDPVIKKEYVAAPHFCTYAYAFNETLPPVDNPLVRKAISAALDRRLLTEVISGGNEESAITFTRPKVFGAVAPDKKIGIDFNPLQAQKWMAEAGYPNGKGFPTITILYDKGETHESIALSIKEFLTYYLNINVELQMKEWNEFLNIVTESPPHIFRAGWCGDYPDADNFLSIFHPETGIFKIGWQNKDYSDILEKAVKEHDRNNRIELYEKAEKILCEDETVVIPIYYESAHCLIKPRIKGWYHMAMGGQHIRNWHIEKNLP